MISFCALSGTKEPEAPARLEANAAGNEAKPQRRTTDPVSDGCACCRTFSPRRDGVGCWGC